ncbi:MAG: 4'-phosphopantetheinyl transferase family protein [Candidatus Methanomethylophilaceae archaeon]
MISCLIVDCRDADPKETDGYIEHLLPERRSLAQSFAFPSDRMMSAVAGLCMQYLSELFSSPVMRLDSGKPVFARKDVHLNVSHSGGIVAAAWSDRPVGVDIQSTDMGYVPNSLFLTDGERRLVDVGAADGIDVWSAKESFLKMTGDGLRVPMDGIGVLTDDGFRSPLEGTDITVMHPLDGFVLAVCGTGVPDVNIIGHRELSREQFRLIPVPPAE